MSRIEIRGLHKVFPGNVAAIDGIDLIAQTGEIVSLLGPSGCGKTTTLRCIAGLETPSAGEIFFDDQRVSSSKYCVPSEKRNIGMVFQSYALWPHKTVFRNVSYPLELKGLKEDAIQKRVMEVLEHLNLAPLRDRFPAQLSGGQQQRVALARSLAPEPAVLLFDEPLSNLDAKLRERLREELRSILKEVGITSIYVTHDQAEAMAISDQIALMNEGRIVQKGEPEDLYERPVNKFVADFVGKGNFLNGKVLDSGGSASRVALEGLGEILCSQRVPQGGNLLVLLRPEHVDIHPGFALEAAKENRWPGKVVRRTYGGNYTNYVVEIGGVTVQVQTVKSGFEKEQQVTLSVDPAKVICIQSD